MIANSEEFQACSHGLVVPPDQAVLGQKDCMDGNCYEERFVETRHGLAAVAAADILVGQDSADGFVVVAHLIEQESIHGAPVVLIAAEEVGIGESEAVGQSGEEETVAAGTTVVGYALNHDPAKQSGRHGQPERQDRHACSCQQERLQVAERSKIDFEGEHWRVYPVFLH